MPGVAVLSLQQRPFLWWAFCLSTMFDEPIELCACKWNVSHQNVIFPIKFALKSVYIVFNCSKQKKTHTQKCWSILTSYCCFVIAEPGVVAPLPIAYFLALTLIARFVLVSQHLHKYLFNLNQREKTKTKILHVLILIFRRIQLERGSMLSFENCWCQQKMCYVIKCWNLLLSLNLSIRPSNYGIVVEGEFFCFFFCVIMLLPEGVSSFLFLAFRSAPLIASISRISIWK